MDPILTWTFSIVLAVLFSSSGWHKIYSPEYYRILISKYLPISNSLAIVVQTVLGLLEITTALLLLIPAFRFIAASIAIMVLTSYLILIAVSLLRGLNMDCGCSGPLDSHKLNPWLLFRNMVLIGVASLLTFSTSSRLLGLPDILIIASASAVAILIYLSFEQLLNNHEKLLNLMGH